MKTKKIQYTVLKISTYKNLILKVSWWALWIEDPINFYKSFFVKNYNLNLNFFFKHSRVLSLNEIKYLLKKDASHLKIAW